MQPMDVGVFAPFKRFYAHYADVWQRSNPGRAITIDEVASLVSSAIIKAFTPENVKSGFKSTGIYRLKSKVFSADTFLPSSVTIRPLKVETSSQEYGLEGESREISAEQNQTYRMATAMDHYILHSISPFIPMPKQQHRPAYSRAKVRSAIITDTPEKQRMVEKILMPKKKRSLADAKRAKYASSTSSESIQDDLHSLLSSNAKASDSVTDSEQSSNEEDSSQINVNSIEVNCYVG